ncbi:glycosyltransferase family 2 protein [Oscillatoria sp. FACHB-1407]|uniref:hormogonium polysaccharide biosynthesis glycosyltransferase HpsE n=1 Tax=Oscillatoria sp. FACHB-1407 TaxID=2692847 RepID=UPI0016860EE9|nr:hormogonium polysaccharide biosynthesis glycosyltransferase HpsE [Oscillatoria sp. FACHB-1407]MBD2464824.1 glycosyltransferase family 2 protein [Oscillatoria sp. FACHB-1407]
MVDFTVAIPTYNGEQRLPEVLDRLKAQVATEPFSWEVIVVDNNSTDGTAAVVQHYQTQWLTNCPLKYIKETRQGAAFARQRAIEESDSEFVGFLDDDNIPATDWVAAAYAFGKEHPKAGAFGSQIHGDFEVSPPKNFKKIAMFLAIVERGSKPYIYEPQKKLLPPGAGLVVRRQVWLDTVPAQLVLNNAGKDAGLASEDLEVGLYIQNAGWEIWYNPDMHMHHKIPKWRLEKEYLLSLFRCVGLSSHHIRMLRVKAWQRPFAFSVYMLNDLHKLVRHTLKYRMAIQDDLVAACEKELLVSNLISPFFLWKKRFFSSAKRVTPANRA